MKPKLTLVSIAALLFAACSFNVKPIYSDKEKAKAEVAVTQIHKWHNDRNFDEIYARFDDRIRAAQTREQFIAAATEVIGQWGKVQSSRLDEAKVFPANPVQVKMVYKTTFDQGNAQEWFTWNVYGDDVRLFEYRVTPGWDK